jgi:hypothetical protein
VQQRLGVAGSGTPSQEETNLLNINEKQETYAGDGTPLRQRADGLRANRIFVNATASYVDIEGRQGARARLRVDARRIHLRNARTAHTLARAPPRARIHALARARTLETAAPLLSGWDAW